MSDTVLTNGAPELMQRPIDSTAAGYSASGARAATGRSVRRRGAEPYDALLWRLQTRQAGDANSLTLGLIGCEARTGTTTVAANLAVRGSELGLGPVLLIDATGRRSRVTDDWNLANGPDLNDVLAGRETLADAICSGPAIGLHVIRCSTNPSHGPGEWDPGAIDSLLTQARAQHGLVLVDLPCVEQLHGSLMLARRLDEVLLVVRAEKSRRQTLEAAADRLVEDGVPLAGVVLNRRRSYLPKWFAGR